MPARQKQEAKKKKKGAGGGRVDAAALLLRERTAAGAATGSLGQPPPAAAALPRMFSCVGCFWVLLSSCLVAVCSFSFLSPAWIVKERGGGGGRRLVVATAAALEGSEGGAGGGEVSFGLLWHCSESLRHMYDCYTFGGLGRFSEIPSGSWQTSAVLCSGGCALLAFSSLLAVIVIFLPSGPCERRVCTLAGYIQTAAGKSINRPLLKLVPVNLTGSTVYSREGGFSESRGPYSLLSSLLGATCHCWVAQK
ncbi:uncharacterized protein LOC117060376 [Lacerta agilis]|uniref:uncharacterized protein LOC117060376 n=1 Tax=Lacerta agilis TaxID=80427 RepID=UPI0014195E9B|nr:uncharacterized protein LOC117060376 [Lacerta agilis]